MYRHSESQRVYIFESESSITFGAAPFFSFIIMVNSEWGRVGQLARVAVWGPKEHGNCAAVVAAFDDISLQTSRPTPKMACC